MVISIIAAALGPVTECSVKGPRGLGNERTSGENPKYSIVEIDQNTENNRGNLRRLVSCETQSANADLKKSQGVKYIFLVNESQKLIWDFDIQTDHLLSARRSHLIIIINKKQKQRELAEFWTLLSRPTTE